MENKYRGEVAFPLGGRASFIRFSLHDFAEVEEHFGKSFWGPVEVSCAEAVTTDIVKLLSIGLKCRDGAGKVTRVWDDLDQDALQDDGFRPGDASMAIMEAISWSYMQKSYEDLIKDALEARKKQTAEAAKQLAEVAKDAGLPFTEEALLSALLKSQTEEDSILTGSGI